MQRGILALGLAAGLLAGAARAEVTDKSPAGFEVTEKVTVAAAPAKVYAAVLTPSGWWDSGHSYSGDARNFTVDLATGCWCEKLPNGFVRHMTLVFADGRSLIRFFGGLGPMQSTGAAGHLAFALKPAGAGTELIVTYDVGGYAKGGLEAYAAPVDKVLGDQVARLKRYAEMGKAD
jgi:hypothetical protein